MQLELHPPSWEVVVMYSWSLGESWGRSRKMWRVDLGGRTAAGDSWRLVVVGWWMTIPDFIHGLV